MELLNEIKRGAPLRLLASGMLAALLLVAYIVGTFFVTIDQGSRSALSGSAEREIVSITDTLIEPSSFHAYSHSPEGRSRAVRFYEELQELRTGTFLSSFDQNLSLVRFDGIDDFSPYGDIDLPAPNVYWNPVLSGEASDVMGFQMNRAVWEFYGLRIEDGAEFDWDAVDYADGRLSVVLGSSYGSLYDVGDVLSLEFYGRRFDANVVGFLMPKAHMYYKGEINYSLDDRIVLPYPSRISEQDLVGDDSDFYRILSFAMISGDVALAEDASISSLSDELARAGRRSGFESYAVVGVPDYLVQFRLVKNLVDQNRILVLVVLGAMMSMVLLVLAWAAKSVASKRSPWVGVMWNIGYPRGKIAGVVMIGSMSYHLLTALLFIGGFGKLVGHDLGVLLLVSAAFSVLVLADVLLQLRWVRLSAWNSRSI
ncbi:MAG TPA: hypothetical protein PKE40_01475 [Arachnia sp.]|nr:hypothetical protein [Arachnia sp.]HMT84998.1 hypothetical protein [Arachnia sp.]